MYQKEQLISFWQEQGIDERIISAFLDIPREYFISPNLLPHTYIDRPLPTLRGQSLSQPSTTILMTQALDVQEGQKILEIGAGVGFHASLLAKLVGNKGKVVTVEIIPELVHLARQNTAKLELTNIRVVEGDGSRGVEEEALFDRVIITAACPEIPQTIIQQTKEGGIIVAPVGDRREQTMVKATKVGNRLEFEFLGSFMFVPLQGKYGFKAEIDGIDV